MLAEVSDEIALRWVPLDLTDDKSTLVQLLAWCHQATSHTWANVDPDPCHQMESLGLNELKKMGSLRHPRWYYLNKIKEPAHMVKNNSRRDLPILSYYKPSQYN